MPKPISIGLRVVWKGLLAVWLEDFIMRCLPARSMKKCSGSIPRWRVCTNTDVFCPSLLPGRIARLSLDVRPILIHSMRSKCFLARRGERGVCTHVDQFSPHPANFSVQANIDLVNSNCLAFQPTTLFWFNKKKGLNPKRVH